MNDIQKEKLDEFKEQHPDFKAKDFLELALNDPSKDVDLDRVNELAIAFNCVAEKSLENYKPFKMNRKFTYRTMKRIFKLNNTFTLEQVKYLTKVMYASLNNGTDSWFNLDAAIALVEYSVVCCSDEMEAIKERPKLPYTTITETIHSQEHRKWEQLTK